MDSDSEDERAAGYVPVLAQTMSNARVNSPAHRPEDGKNWMKDGVSLYTNELFTDGDVLGGDGQPPGLSSPSGQNGAQAMRKGPSLAAKRQERLQAGTPYTPNSLLKNAGSMPRPGASPGSPGLRASAVDSPTAYRPSMLSQTGAAATTIPVGRTSDQGPTAAPGTWANMRMEYDPNEGQEDAMPISHHSGYAERQQAVPRVVPQLDLTDMPSFLMQPGPKNGPVMCVIVRDRGSARSYPRYALFLEEGRRFLLSARKRKKQTTSNYVISLDYEDLNRESETFFGKVRANFVGTEFTVYDNGAKPGKGVGDDSARQELGAVTYQYNVLGTRGPRKMTAAIPALDGSGRMLYHPRGAEDCIAERIKHRRQLEELVVMGNKPPRWNDELNAYCLNFNGRVTEASVKNFQLVADDNHNHVILQFGKVGKDTFTMDYQWPISAFQAFAICMSSFDNKLACE